MRYKTDCQIRLNKNEYNTQVIVMTMIFIVVNKIIYFIQYNIVNFMDCEIRLCVSFFSYHLFGYYYIYSTFLLCGPHNH